jgi:hypothetical protein
MLSTEQGEASYHKVIVGPRAVDEILVKSSAVDLVPEKGNRVIDFLGFGKAVETAFCFVNPVDQAGVKVIEGIWFPLLALASQRTHKPFILSWLRTRISVPHSAQGTFSFMELLSQSLIRQP